MKHLTLNLIGAGRVGQTLAHLWHGQGQDGSAWQVQDVCTRSLPSAEAACAFIGAGRAVASVAAMRPADVWMLAVPDAHIAAAADQLAAHTGAAPAIAFHCSGAWAASALEPLTAQGWHTASAHCILSFTDPTQAVAQFAGTPCALEGDPTACQALQAAFTAMGAQCFHVESEHKVLYHAAAVFATNFIPVLHAVAEDAWRTVGMPPALIAPLRDRLLANASANISRLGPAGALTGPAQRGDTAAIARQAQVVHAWDAPAGAAYSALSALALRLAGHEISTAIKTHTPQK
jgi:predicted short-subunit dehydrogenase-like oxidoreductase (DUF2520 family)